MHTLEQTDSSIGHADSPAAPPHVLVDARFSARQRGGDRCRYQLACHLSRQDAARYTFLTYADTRETLLAGAADARAVATHARPNRHPQGDLFEHVALPALARRLGADIYHGTFNVLPLRRAAPATIVTVHDMAVFAHPEAYGRRFARYGQVLVRAAIRQADRVITVSDATASEVARYLPDAAHKTVTVRNGVGEEFVTAGALPDAQVRDSCRRLKIPTPYVLFVGNLEPKKNLPRLIEAFGRLQAATPLPHTLVIVGERLASGPDSGISPHEAAGPRLHFTGYVEDRDLPLLYRGADLIAYPSIYEGFGMPVLEGMAVGVPVLTSSVSSLPEVAGGAAMLVDPFDVEVIARGLYAALTDAAWRRSAVAAGRARAAALTWEDNARRTAAVYHQVWDQRRARGGRTGPAARTSR